MTTITASTTIGIDLNPAIYTSPVTIAAGVAISNPGYPYAVYRHAGATTFFAIQNDGAITSASGGVYLGPGGAVTNASTASIDASIDAVKIAGGDGTVVNDGRVAATGINGVGVYLGAGGSVTNTSSASVTGGVGVSIVGAGTVTNSGSITGGSSGRYVIAVGVRLDSGGSVTNAASASIVGDNGVAGEAISVVNAGRIAGTASVQVIGGSVGGDGVRLLGGSVTNATSASIAGYNRGVYVNFVGLGTVVNDGAIAGTHSYGVELLTGGIVSNAPSATITGSVGVSIAGGGTLTNAGMIVGSDGTAVAFGGTSNNFLVLDSGFSFSGIVAGGTQSSDRLELASALSAGTVTGLGTDFIRFHSILFDSGAQWSIAGIQRGLAGPIYGFANGDTIELTGSTATGSSFSEGVLTLDLVGGRTATLDLPGPFTLASFNVTNVAEGVDVTPLPCFCAGTRILTTAGEIGVENLRIGARVVTQNSCRLARVVWLGHRRIDCRRHSRPTDLWPVCVRAGAFGDDLPVRDLLLSSDHAVFVDNVLVPVRFLLNGSTIVQEQIDEVVYYHVELAAHGVILAEGLPCESYLDTGNRAAFTDGEHPTMAAA